MKVYRIHFTGHYPIGAVALASGKNIQEAVHTLYNSQKFAPHRNANSLDDLIERSIRLPKLSCSELWSVILLDGSY